MSHDYEARMMRVVTHISRNPAGDLSLDALADVAAMSRFHWHRVFQGIMGETVAHAVRRIRLHLAAAKLLRDDRPVARIAAEVGYPNLSSFTRAFTHAYGQPPAAFRESARPEHLAVVLVQPHPKGDTPMFPITIQHRPALRLAAAFHKGDYQTCGEAFERVGTIFVTRNLLPHARGMIGVYYDNPAETAPEDLRAHAGMAVEDGFEIPEGLEEVTLPASRCAILEHKGPYATLGAAYDVLYGKWLPESGEEPADLPPYEVYLNDPATTPATELRTDICLPLKG